jgi:glutamate racemase
MKLGVFDSGLGGLLIAKAIRTAMPDIDMLYAGDTLHLPYGNRSPEAIYTYTRQAMEYLFYNDCALIVVACNTASAGALRRLQQEYLPQSPYKDRRILGVVVPTLECAAEQGRRNLGLLATNHTVRTNIYGEELSKIDPAIHLTQINAPLLVPMIENDGVQWIVPVLEHYLKPLKTNGVDSVILGCTHYSLIKSQIQNFMGPEVTLLSQDEIIPPKVEDYLKRHPEIARQIGRNGEQDFAVSDVTEAYSKTAAQIYGEPIPLRKADFFDIPKHKVTA